MSYSFSVTGADKVTALKAVEAAMAEVVASQPVHVRDQEPACRAAAEMVELLQDDETKDVVISVSGYLGWDCSPPLEPGRVITSVNVSVSAYLGVRETK